MANKIVLISDDSDFFDYIRTKLELRKSDELYTFDYDSIPEKFHLLETSVLIINSENSKEKALDLLNLFKGTPIIISAYNDDEIFRRKCYRAGAIDFITLLIPDSDFRARMIPALTIASLLEKNKFYRDILASNNVLSTENEVLLNYDEILEKELKEINLGKRKAVFAAISPNDTSKFLIQSSLIESIILNNIRKGDLLMNYAPNKYFLLMFDIDVIALEKIWNKISTQFHQQMYIGFCNITNQKREQLINEVLNKLHTAINQNRGYISKNEMKSFESSDIGYTNFKMFKQEFLKKIPCNSVSSVVELSSTRRNHSFYIGKHSPAVGSTGLEKSACFKNRG